MMNIESKKFRIKSGAAGCYGFDITNKSTGEMRHVSSAPSAGHLAAINERQFDREMTVLFNS